jgi:acetyltransferase-like isoleucine patch superfamily enzyme
VSGLLNQLRNLWRERRQQVDTQFKRTLSFGDYVVDRWEKARALGFGEGASIYDSALVIGDVTVGEQTWVGPGVILDGSGGLTIGSCCSISAGAQVYSHDTVQWATSGGKSEPERSPTRIGDRCYIGPNVVVSKGVTIGDGCIVGAGAVVLRDLPSGVKAVGVPARIVQSSAADGDVQK